MFRISFCALSNILFLYMLGYKKDLTKNHFSDLASLTKYMHYNNYNNYYYY